MEEIKKHKLTKSFIIFIVFLTVGLVLWKTQNNSFYLFNFGYIGLAVSLGSGISVFLPREKKVWGRKISQLLIAIYLLVGLGVLERENMQIEGFFFYLLAGAFSGSVIHYLVAKIFGTFLFGRGFCGWACWTATVLDFFPWMKPKQGRLKNWGIIRYIHFFSILALVLILWFGFQMNNFQSNFTMLFNWLIIGNIAYYAIAIILVTALKDNRAFCKYACPIPVLMKIGARFAIWKIEIAKEKCTKCKICERNCPMNIQLLEYMNRNQRISSTECIACQQCVNGCPEKAIQFSKGFDCNFNEHINYCNQKNIGRKIK